MEIHTIYRDGEGMVVLLDDNMKLVQPVYEFLKFQYTNCMISKYPETGRFT